jgi:1,2-diacylglycerol 3-beta-glucosyltransferase
MTVFTVLLAGFGAYLSAYVAYHMLLIGANALVPDPEPFEPTRLRRFNVLVPAHNEELHLPRLLGSLRLQQYPQDRYRVTVIADNCSDGTVAASLAFDVDVVERVDPERRGKGYAIGWTLQRLDLAHTDAILIIDGDSVADERLLTTLNMQMECGDRVVQCYNGVANPGQSWFTRLMDVSRTIANEIIHPGKRKLALSSHLMGNGMCFDMDVIRTFGWNAFSVGEDWEYYATLILSGTYVGYSRHARVYHQESINLRQASSQRLRWSSSRFQVLRQHGWSLIVEGMRTGNVRCVDAALPLVFPNPSLGMNLTAIGVVLSALHALFTDGAWLVAWFGSLALLQLGTFLLGVFYTKDPLASALSIFLAPGFLAWKLGIDMLSVFGVGSKHWKPTARRLS